MSINVLQAVETYNEAGLGAIQNKFCGIATANKRYENFQNTPGNLGGTVLFRLSKRFVTTNGLNSVFQPVVDRVQTLTIATRLSVSYSFTTEEFVFNVEDYMRDIGIGAIAELATDLEKIVLNNFITNTYRFFGDGLTPVTSFNQIGKALAMFRNYGAPKEDVRGYLSDLSVPDITTSGLAQFAMTRNNELANSWEIGTFSGCEWYDSNLLQTQTAGNVGNLGQTLTVVSTNDPTGQNITQITFSGATANDASAIMANDSLYFLRGVTGQPDLYFAQFVGHGISANPVQILATANAGANSSGVVVVNITPTLDSTSDATQNIFYNIVAGMKVKVLPSHKAGCITSGNSLFLAMPKLPMKSPFITASQVDPESGAALRMYHGSLLDQDVMGNIHDVIEGDTLVPENSMKLVFPLTQ